MKKLGFAAAAALSCASVSPAAATPCLRTNFFTQFFAGNSQANCTISDKTILGISQNSIAEQQGIEVTSILPTPADNPGLTFFVNTNFSAGNGASFVFTVTATGNSMINGMSLAVQGFGGTADVTIDLSNGQSLDVALNGIDSINFAPITSLTVTTTQASAGNGLASIVERFSEVSVPEPSTIALVGVGLAGIGAARRRKRR